MISSIGPWNHELDAGGEVPLRLAIVGAGSAGGLHAAASRRVPDLFSVAAVVDPSEDAASRLAGPRPAECFETVDELIDSGLAEAAIVASPHTHHTTQVKALLDAGIPTLVEKPMAVDPNECAALDEHSRMRRTPLVAGYMQRYLPSVAAAKNLIHAGEIGQMRTIIGSHSSRYEPGTRPDWFLDPTDGAGGILTNIGSHAVDRALVLAEPTDVRILSAWGAMSRVIVDASFTLDLGLGRSAVCTLTGTGLPVSETTYVIGTDAAIALTIDGGVTVFHQGQPTWSRPPGPDDVSSAFVAQLVDFHAAARGGRSEVDAAYGVRIAALLHRVQQLVTARSEGVEQRA